MLDPEAAELIGIELPKEKAMVGGAFDAASRFDQTMALWQPPLASADFETIPDKPVLDARVRDSLRNDAYVRAGAEIHQDNIVGAQFVLNSKPAHTILGLDDTWAGEFQEEVEAKFQLWADSPENWIDKQRIHNFTSLIRLGTGLMVQGSEILATAEWMRDGRPFQTAIQMIDTDRLSNPWGMFNNPKLRAGVVKNDNGVPVAYHIRKAHPADFTWFANFNVMSWDLVQARKSWGRQQVIHIYDPWRVDQSRGVSAMVASLKEMRMTKRFRDIVLQNAVVNATYAASIESDLPSDTVMAQLGGGNVGEVAIQKLITQYSSAFLGAVAEYTQGAKNLAIDGVKIPHLFPGTKLQLRPAGSGSALGNEFESSLLRYLAANLGVSYEQLSRDYSNVNYASFRAGATETWKGMQAKKKRGADRFASAIFRLWLEEAINTGQITSMPRKAPSIYDSSGKLGMNFDAYAACDWIGASRGQVDELKETQAAVQRIKFGLSTYEDELARLGKDFRKVFAQIAREKKMAKDADILQELFDPNMQNAVDGGTSPDSGEAKDQ